FRDGVQIVRDGELGKFVPQVREISFSGRLARERGQRVRYITDRAVFALEDDGLVLIEVAPGVDVERDVLGRMGFRPRVATPLGPRDPRVSAGGRRARAAACPAAGAAPPFPPRGGPRWATPPPRRRARPPPPGSSPRHSTSSRQRWCSSCAM